MAKTVVKAKSVGIMSVVKIDDKLAKVVGPEPKPRTEIIKKFWEYIKKNDLQDKAKRQNINTDDNLKAICEGKSQITMFEISGFVNKHVIKDSQK